MAEKEIKTSGRVHFIVINTIRLILFLASLGAYFSGRWLVLLVGSIAFIITFLPYLLRKIYAIHLPAEFEITIILFIYGILFLGEIRGIYAPFWWWDALLNLFAAIALGFVGYTVISILQKEEMINANPLIISILAFCFAFSSACLWEIFEFSLDKFLGFNLQHSSLIDTMTDIIVAAIGSAAVAIAGYFYTKSGKGNILSAAVIKLVKKYPKIFGLKKSPQEQILKLIQEKEGETLEFKSTLRTNTHTKEIDKNIEFAALKTLVAFLNTKGGTLLIGVSNEGNIEGIQKDNFQNQDKALLHITNLIKTHIGSQLMSFINLEIIKIEDKEIIKITCKPSAKRVFLRRGDEELFYIRNGPASIRLEGSSLLDYIENKFKKFS